MKSERERDKQTDGDRVKRKKYNNNIETSVIINGGMQHIWVVVCEYTSLKSRMWR